MADLAAQIAAVQGAALNEDDLALVMIGMHDILELYGRYPTSSRDTLLAEGTTTIACVDREGEIRQIPEALLHHP